MIVELHMPNDKQYDVLQFVKQHTILGYTFFPNGEMSVRFLAQTSHVFQFGEWYMQEKILHFKIG